MAWNNQETVVKFKGQCWNRGKHKYCFYWVAKKSIESTEGDAKTLGYRCSLFEEDKEGYDSLPACNRRYGQTYDGRPIT